MSGHRGCLALSPTSSHVSNRADLRLADFKARVGRLTQRIRRFMTTMQCTQVESSDSQQYPSSILPRQERHHEKETRRLRVYGVARSPDRRALQRQVRLAKSPKLVRFVLSLMAVFAVLGALPDRSFGQGLTCGWCYEMFLRGSLVHWFPRGGSECGWPNPGAGYVCARCGGKSHCHGYHSPHRWGPCHILCGGQTTQQALSNAVSDLRSGMDIMDLDRVAETIASTHDGVWVE